MTAARASGVSRGSAMNAAERWGEGLCNSHLRVLSCNSFLSSEENRGGRGIRTGEKYETQRPGGLSSSRSFRS